MRKILFLSFLMLISFFNLSCDEDFSPKTTYREKYILNCIINASTGVTTQIATLSKTYNIEGYNPYNNKTDPALVGADIKLFYKGVAYSFRDSAMVRKDTSRYSSPKSFYVLNSPKFKAGDSVKIVAKLNNGVVLSSAIKLPPTFYFKPVIYYIDPTEATALGNKWGLSWENNDFSLLFSPRFTLNYIKRVNGMEYAFKKEIPIMFSSINGISIPIYPPISHTSSVTFDFAIFDSVMTQISANDPNKEYYRIGSTTFQLLTFDENLTNYYSIINGYMDDVTVRLDEGEYTNIKGGLGVFGAYIQSISGYLLDEAYINSFGYIKVI